MDTLHPSKLFPLVITERFDAMKAFYADKLGAQITFDMEHYLQVRFGDSPHAPELAFMRAGIDRPVPTESFPGRGVLVSIQVEDADARARALVEAGLELAAPVSDKPWGWRSFMVKDPSGLVLDFFHPVA